MSNRYRRILKWMIVVVLAITAGIYGYGQNNWIEVDHLSVPIEQLPPAFQGFTIAHVSDVHLNQNAASVDRLIQLVREAEPDLIVLTGDLVDQGTTLEESELERLSAGMVNIAKTYAVTGNHEHIGGRAEQWRMIVAKQGVIVLDNQVDRLILNGNQLLIAGLEDGTAYSTQVLQGIEEAEEGLPLILLAHRPELFPNYASKDHPIRPALVFSGHAHGGQFRIPFLQSGLIAPDQGFFPTWTSGLYTAETGVQMVVSRGLGNSIIPVRIHNRPHLPIIHLIGDELK